MKKEKKYKILKYCEYSLIYGGTPGGRSRLGNRKPGEKTSIVYIRRDVQENITPHPVHVLWNKMIYGLDLANAYFKYSADALVGDIRANAMFDERVKNARYFRDERAEYARSYAAAAAEKIEKTL